MRAAAQRAGFELKGPPVLHTPCHPRAPGEISRARRSVIAAKEAAVFHIAANWGGTTEQLRQPSSLCRGGGCFCFCRAAVTVNKSKERIVYAMDRFE